MGGFVGVDTNSYGFHVGSMEKIAMPADYDRVGWLGHVGWFQAPSYESQRDRRILIYPAARDFFRTLPDKTTVCIEEPLVLPKNIETTRALVMAAGIIEAAFWEACPDATLFWVNVSTWRRQVLNPAKGESPRKKDEWKALARKWVLDRREFWPLSEEEYAEFESEEDLYDAWCIMQYGRSLVRAA